LVGVLADLSPRARGALLIYQNQPDPRAKNRLDSCHAESPIGCWNNERGSQSFLGMEAFYRRLQIAHKYIASEAHRVSS
jgi:hypothetical protein